MHVVATAGHVDHGKSSLVRALTGMEPDRLAEERRRGLTIELGFAWTQLEPAAEAGGPSGPSASDEGAATVAFVDVPGHDRFVPTMLAGVGASPAALFVVAADDGWSAQSQEHLDILDLLEVPVLVTVISKVDRVDDARVDAVVEDLAERGAGTVLAEAPVVRTSVMDGAGLDVLRRVLADRLATLPAASSVGRARLWVDRAFSVTGAGTVVTGTLAGGQLRVGDEVTAARVDARVRIRAIEMLGEPTDTAPPGSRVACNLAGDGASALQRGDALLGDGAPWCSTRSALVELHALPGARLGQRGAWAVHAGTARTSARLHPVLDPIDGPTTGFAYIELDDALPLQHGDRLVVRDAGRALTVGGGRVLDPRPGPRPRGTEARLRCAQHAEGLTSRDPAAVVRGLVGLRGGVAARVDVVARAGPSPVDDVPGLVAVADHLVEQGLVDRWRDVALRAVDGAPADQGVAVDAVVAGLVATGCPATIAAAIVRGLQGDGTLSRHRTTLIRAAHADELLQERRRRIEALAERLERAGLEPPTPRELAAELELAHDDVQELVTAGRVVRGDDLLFAAAALDEAVQVLRRSFAGNAFTAAEARSALGLSRRHAVPLLEALRSRGATSFDGQTHRLVTAAV